MEKKKLLLISISVGVFLVMVIGAAILAFPSRNSPPGVTQSAGWRPALRGSDAAFLPPVQAALVETSPASPASVDAADMARNREELQGILNPPAQDKAGRNSFFITGEGERPEASALETSMTFPAESLSPKVIVTVPASPGAVKAPETRAAPTAPKAKPQVTSPARPKAAEPQASAPQAAAPKAAAPKAAAPKTAAPKPESAPPPKAASAKPPAQVKPETPAPAAAPPAAAPLATARSVAPASTAAARSASVASTQIARSAPAKIAQSARSYAYWVQTCSFLDTDRARAAKQDLEEKGVVSNIVTRSIDGQVWFRVRVGPYTSKPEADYWYSLIKEIDGFEGSLVMQSEL